MAVSPARILISNDDGIHADGLKVLEAIAREISDDVWVVAPESEQSGAGHSLTLSLPLRIRRVANKRYAINGTPTDCVMMAINKIMPEKPTLMLSGVNRGGNLAEHITYSGTVSVAMEGTLAGVPSIALSQCLLHGETINWSVAEKYGRQVIENLLDTDWDKDVLINVNFPPVIAEDVKGVHVSVQGRRKIDGVDIISNTDPRGFEYHWFGLGNEVGVPGVETDLESARNGYISVTPLHLDLTHHKMREHLSDTIVKEF